MICLNCGKELPSNVANHCPFCGSKLTKNQSTTNGDEPFKKMMEKQAFSANSPEDIVSLGNSTSKEVNNSQKVAADKEIGMSYYNLVVNIQLYASIVFCAYYIIINILDITAVAIIGNPSLLWVDILAIIVYILHIVFCFKVISGLKGYKAHSPLYYVLYTATPVAINLISYYIDKSTNVEMGASSSVNVAAMLFLVFNCIYFLRRNFLFTQKDKKYEKDCTLIIAATALSLVIYCVVTLAALHQPILKSADSGYTIYDNQSGNFVSNALGIKIDVPNELRSYSEEELCQRDGITFTSIDEYNANSVNLVNNHVLIKELFAESEDGLNNVTVVVYYPYPGENTDLSSYTKESLFDASYIEKMKKQTQAKSIDVSESTINFCGHEAKRFDVVMDLGMSMNGYMTEIVFTNDEFVGYVIANSYFNNECDYYIKKFKSTK